MIKLKMKNFKEFKEEITPRLYLDTLYKNMENLYIHHGLKKEDWENFKQFANWVVTMENALNEQQKEK